MPADAPATNGAATSTGKFSTMTPAGEGIASFLGILRIIQWVFSLIAFACMAGRDTSQVPLDAASAYLLAVNVIIFVYTSVLLVLYLMNRLGLSPLWEFTLDFALWFAILGSASVVAGECNTFCNSSFKGNGALLASIVFSFFVMLAFVPSTWLNYRKVGV